MFLTLLISLQKTPVAFDSVILKRKKLRSDKDFKQADVMRDKLKEIGLFIKDGDDGAWYWENS